QLLEVTRRRDHIAAGSLDGLDVECGVLGRARLGVPHAAIFGVEQPRELIDAVEAAVLPLLAVWAAEAIRKRHELSPIAEVTEATPVSIGRGDGRGTERATVIAAFEGEHQALAAGGVAHELERVLHRL